MAVGAFDLAAQFQAAAAVGLRVQGRLGLARGRRGLPGLAE
jgi:hypothetical protein